MSDSGNLGALSGQIALVTGSSRGIGAATAEALAGAGAQVVLTGRDRNALADVERRIRDTGGDCTTIPLELTDSGAITGFAAGIADRWGRLDIFVHSAAVLPAASPVNELAPGIYAEALAVNVGASHELLFSLDGLLRRSEHGRVVLLTSPVAKFAVPEWSGYASTKAAQEMLFECYGKEADGSSNVRVALINPGAVRTEMRAKAFPDEDPLSVKPPEAVAIHITELLIAGFDNLLAESVPD